TGMKSGQKPQFNEDRTLVLVLDGEIYNYHGLRKELEGKGHYFHTDSDAETILHLYEEKGVNFLNELQGVFSLALWDKNTNRLLLARDRLGIKPLYYASDGYRLIFASEIRAIFQDNTVAKELNPQGVADYFRYLYIPAPKTVFLGIYKIPPGYYLLCSPAGYTVKKYWDLDFSPRPEEGSFEQCQYALLDLLQEAIHCRLPASGPPAGLFLSGGIGSAALLCLAHKGGVPLCAHTIGFEEPDLDERPFSRTLTRYFQTSCQEWVLSPKGMLAQLDHLAFCYDEPIGDATAVLTFELARLAGQHTRVALSGEAGDGNFAPFRCQRLPLWGTRFQKITSKDAAHLRPASSAQEYLESIACFSFDGIQRLLNEDFYHDLCGYDPSVLFQDLYRKTQSLDPLSRRQYIGMKTYLPDNVLTQIDRASMANSLQVQLPLLDHRLIEFLSRTPIHFKDNGSQESSLLKKALKGALPSDILARKKQKAELPLGAWFTGEWRLEGEKYLWEQHLSSLSGVLNFDEISSLWHRHQQRRQDYSRQIWAVLFFQRWYHRHMARPGDRAEDLVLALS
ncbi:MAG: asparagine synthase (glutamine-hydrolyzing), partial [bacterium]